MDNENAKKQLAVSDFTETTLVVNLSQLYKDGMTESELYDAARGYWGVSKEKMETIKYVMPVYKGEVLEVYEPSVWHDAGTTPMSVVHPNAAGKGLYEFEGKLAPDAVRAKYKGNLVSEVIHFPMQKTFQYLPK